MADEKRPWRKVDEAYHIVIGKKGVEFPKEMSVLEYGWGTEEVFEEKAETWIEAGYKVYVAKLTKAPQHYEELKKFCKECGQEIKKDC